MTVPETETDALDLRQRAASNTAFVLIGIVGSRIVGLVAVGYLARRFEAEGLGSYNLTIALSAVFALLSDLGISIHLGREAAAHPESEKDLVRRAIVASLFSGVAAFLLCNSAAAVAGYETELRRWILFASTLTLLAPALVPAALLQARLQGRRAAAVALAGQLLYAAATAAVVITEQGIETLVVLQALSNVGYAGTIVFATGVWRRYRLPFTRQDVSEGLRLLARAAPYGSLALLALVLVRLDTFLLSVIGSERAVGFYSSAWKLTELLHFVPTAVAASVIPIVASQVSRQPELIARGLARAFRYLTLLGIPVLVGGLVLAGPIVTLVYGSAFDPAVAPYRVLLVAEVSYFFGGVMAAALVGMRCVRQLTTILLVSLPINAAACIVFLPRFDYLGAAWISLATELLTTVYMTAFVARRLEVGAALLPAGAALRSLVACVPMVGAIALVGGPLGAGVLAQVVSGAAAYGVALVAVRGIGAEELAIVRGMVSR